LSALQTEKRSPIIAPPEVLLNSNQAQTQGGLSGNVLFQYKSRSARKVEILGDFNNWSPQPMYRDKNHVWVTVKDLPAGSYRYSFLINGKREIRDPWNTSFDPSMRPRGCSTFVVPEVLSSKGPLDPFNFSIKSDTTFAPPRSKFSVKVNDVLNPELRS
jgi:hypothetical protein